MPISLSMVGRYSEVVILNSESENPYQPIFKARNFDSLYKLECFVRISTTGKIVAPCVKKYDDFARVPISCWHVARSI